MTGATQGASMSEPVYGKCPNSHGLRNTKEIKGFRGHEEESGES